MSNCPQFFDTTPPTFSHFHTEFKGRVEPECVIEMVGRALKPHKMTISGAPRVMDSTFQSLKVGNLQIFYLQYGVEVQVDPGELNDFTLIQMPIHGAGRYTCGGYQVTGAPDVAAVLSPREVTHLQFSSELRQIIVRIEQSALERACVEHIELLPEKGLRFHPLLDLNSAAGRAWCGALSYILEGSVAFPHLLHTATYAERCERLLIDTLLFAQDNSCSEHLAGGSTRRTVRPAYVRRAEDYMRDRLAEIVSVEEIARAVGVSSRALYYAFRQTHDQTPMSYLRELRLKAVHAELKSGNPATMRLVDVAIRWGFSHYGHFASRYRRRFGVRPQDTLNGKR
ncbi:AraC family transcriptional regulator [Paraburkholderia sp. JHI869]|uniref:AraC family transcriptional regulator n=1 Tax=Paraburkholderia sp. JHI869 TaxID=3112959 RepID=UPI00317612B1